MSESESSDDEPVHKKDAFELQFVANFVREHTIIINKSKIPSVVQKKEEVLKSLKKEFETTFGKLTDDKKLLKQVNNLKASVKKKTDVNASGNKKKKLSIAEQAIYEAMQGIGVTTNPVLHKLSGKLAVGVNEVTVSEKASESNLPTNIPHRSPPSTIIPPPPLKKAKIIDQFETEETKHLTNTELQRLVLLEQLQVLKLKKEKLQRQMINP